MTTLADGSWNQIEVLALGGSAGAIEALKVLLPALGPKLPLAVVVVVHLPTEVSSELRALFAPLCQLPVREAADKEPIERGTIYFAPAGYHLLVERERAFALSIDEPVHYSRPSIDVLFESIADVYGEKAVAVILSGASDDGSAGLAAVRRAGGIAVVQEPATASMPRMPQSALKALAPHPALCLEDLISKLGQCSEVTP